jgi:diguanylate cyclase
MTEPSHTEPRRQALRLKRFLLASCTYVVGFLILALCSAVGLLPGDRLALLGAVFLVVNSALFVVFRSGWNKRFADPSLTLAQLGTGACVVCLILVFGEQVHFVAVPFYSSLFVFAMLQLTRRQLVAFEAFVLVTYGLAVATRIQLFADRLDLRIEALNAALVVLSSVWYAAAAGYISNLRLRLRESVATIERLATTDAMTGTWNRRHIDALLASELQRKARIGGELCIALVDLDHFKSINDRFGHLVGDTVLTRVAQAMSAQLRSVDPLGRFGGEEFLVVLPGTPMNHARACAERLRSSVAGMNVLPDLEARVTISIGLAECLPGESADALLNRADRALYRAKREGRNRVAVGAVREPAPDGASV